MLIEREAQLKSLREAAQSARTGNGRIVVLSGEAGIGKTALLRSFQAETKDIRIYWGGSDALFTPRPLGPLRDKVDALDEKTAALVENMASLYQIFPALLAALHDRIRGLNAVLRPSVYHR